jgi:DNA-binding response OmpR family regulator
VKLLRSILTLFKKKHTILIVDDDPMIVSSLEAVLKGHGYKVESAFDGNEGLAKAKEILPSLILMDISMPHLQGDIAAMRLGSDEELRKIPIIMLTATDTIEEKVLASHIGIVDYVTKPYDVGVLLAKIKKILPE